MDKTQNKEILILQTAMDVFIEKGRHGAKMQEIADKAGINKALLHYYHRSKEKLYAKIFEFLFWQSLGDLIKLFETDLPFKQHLQLFINSYIDLLDRNPKIPLFLLRELSEGGNVVKNVLNNLLESGKYNPDPVINVITKAINNGEIIRMDPRQIVATVLGSCLFYSIAEPIFTTIFIREGNFNRPKFIKERKKAIFKIISDGLSPRGALK